MAEMTPMMRQYMEIKDQNPDSILFFRLGDFYEMFGADARTASRELDLALTTRDKDKNKSFDEKVPMCGIPYHASDAYIARLIAKGYKVAICEQTEDPAAAKGLVKRDIIRVVTPGTVIDSACLDENRSNFCAGIYLDEDNAALAVCDISTGMTHATAFSGAKRLTHLLNELGRFSPAEAVVNETAFFDETLHSALENKFRCHVEKLPGGSFRAERAEKTVRDQFGEDAAERLPRNNPAAVLALGALLDYIHETQKTDLRHIDRLDYYEQGRFMELDLATRRNLELTETLRSKEKKGSLLWVLDKTKTAMGGRLLRSWLERPLLSVTAINRRLDAVSALVNATMAREELILALTGIADMERLIGRIVYGTAGGRELAALRGAMEHLPAVKVQIAPFSKGRLRELDASLDDLGDLAEEIGRTLKDEPPFSVREGELIRDGFDPEVDRLRGILHGGKDIIAQMEAAEKERTGIRTLKIGYNKVFGYYIEVSNSFRDQVPDTYIRKQTLVNGERYITRELKNLESDILSANDRVSALEYEIFTRLRLNVASQVSRIQQSAAAVAELDALCSLASVAVKNNYCCPAVDESGVIEIHDGRHPVVERMRSDALFVPNDTLMGAKEDRVAIITGPNMAGKSTYMRQVALISLMAQIGSFVPARAAHVGVVDRIFTRIGASDDLSAGQSTFMVEMTEVSNILHSATKNSLLILDEIGRGTSTFDGMSIARSVLEYCADAGKLGAKTLFATHYHELTELEDTLPGVKNFNIAVRTRGEEIIFLRKIIPGGADRSYGIEVAQLAGLPRQVVERARIILRRLEEDAGRPVPAQAQPDDQVSFSSVAEQEVIELLRRCQVDTLSPIEALNTLYELKQKL
ncbi:MAG: DNA mismatch repair protein MutS [Oscillospiraceae bacterium]|nr:DNA mismatch repair protein MutS [Oscillospiraceae bacterium]